MEIKKMIKKNKLIYYLIKEVRNIRYIFQMFIFTNITFNIKKFLRVNRILKETPYEKLKGLKNKHIGERCFIVATGPSLTIEDLEKLKNEVTFSMNSVCLAFNETDWRPTYFGIQDENVYLKLKKHIDGMSDNCKFISDTIPKQINVKLPDASYIFPLNMLNHNINHKKYHTKFSDDIFAVVYSGYSITYSLIQIAVYMGFKEIYLIGADCNYSSNMKHHFKEYGHVDPTFSSAGEMMNSSYKVAKKFADRNNIKIFNATRGGMLEVFERVDLDRLLSENKSFEVMIK